MSYPVVDVALHGSWPEAGKHAAPSRNPLKSQPEHCIHCNLCSRTCPTGFPVQQLVENANTERAESILFGHCIDVCPQNVLNIEIFC